jgi:hypothetical protein
MGGVGVAGHHFGYRHSATRSRISFMICSILEFTIFSTSSGGRCVFAPRGIFPIESSYALAESQLVGRPFANSAGVPMPSALY